MYRTPRGRRVLAPLAIAGALALSLAACGGDDDDDAADSTSAPAATAAPAGTDAPGAATTHGGDHQTVAVNGIDYGYENLPEEVPAGTMLTFTNSSDVEAHELVAFRLADDETRPVDEIAALPPEELFAMFTGEPTMVLIAGPGEEGMAVVGDGTLTEPGRYIVACSIPIGADPAELMGPPSSDPAATEGSAPEPEGPPHFTAGMYGEILVTEA